MSKAVSYFINRKLALGWSAWSSSWEESARKRAALQRGLGHMLNSGLSRGWGAWVAMAVERAEVMRKLRKSLSRMMNRKVALGFAGWLCAIAHRQMREVQRGHLMKALLHLTNHELSRGWSAWCIPRTARRPRMRKPSTPTCSRRSWTSACRPAPS
jgi:hypothetical protein